MLARESAAGRTFRKLECRFPSPRRASYASNSLRFSPDLCTFRTIFSSVGFDIPALFVNRHEVQDAIGSLFTCVVCIPWNGFRCVGPISYNLHPTVLRARTVRRLPSHHESRIECERGDPGVCIHDNEAGQGRRHLQRFDGMRNHDPGPCRLQYPDRPVPDRHRRAEWPLRQSLPGDCFEHGAASTFWPSIWEAHACSTTGDPARRRCISCSASTALPRTPIAS